MICSYTNVNWLHAFCTRKRIVNTQGQLSQLSLYRANYTFFRFRIMTMIDKIKQTNAGMVVATG